MSYLAVKAKANALEELNEIYKSNSIEAKENFERRGYEVLIVDNTDVEGAFFFLNEYEKLSPKQIIEYVVAKHKPNTDAIIAELDEREIIPNLVDLLAITGRGVVEGVKDVDLINERIKQRQDELWL